jgi:hypothetical protein
MPAIVVDIQRQPGAHRDGSAHQERAAETAAQCRSARRSLWCTTPPPASARPCAMCNSR